MKKYPHVVVSVFIKDEDNRIALFRSPQWPGLWIPPGGHIEYCERMKDAAKREAKEELGVSVYDLKVVNVIEMIKNKINSKLPHLVSIHFLCKIKDNKFILVSGMPAEVMIKIGERTPLSYFVKPLTDMFSRSFNEE